MDESAIFFACEREHRCGATRARDLAASATNRTARERHLADAARHAAAIPGSLNEALLIRSFRAPRPEPFA